MKKYVRYLLFLILLIFPVMVFAAGSVTVSGTSLSMAPNGTASFNVVASNAAGRITIASSDTSIVTVNKSNEWVENGTLTVTATGKKTGNAKITVTVDAATFDKEEIKKTYTINVRVKSTNNNLGSLSITGGTLSPGFAAGTTSYSATVDATSITINASAADSTAKVSGTGKKNLAYGKNTFKVVVTSESGATKTYTLTITRPDNRSANNYLKSLSISDGTISFKKGTNNYNVTVDGNVSKLTVSAAVEDSKASFVSGFGSRTVDLKYGANSVLVKVKAENQQVRVYTLNVTRTDNRSTNNNLSSLQISGTSLPFDKNIINYNVSVPYETTQVEVFATPEDSKAKVVVNNFPLAVGDNNITVVVTSESEAVKTYTIVVKRLSEAEKMSDNNNVSEMKIFGHDFELEEDKYEYDISIGADENELLFYITMEDANANYVISGNEELKDGSSVVVTSISQSGVKQDYTFSISKEALKSEKNNIILTIICSVVALVLGIGIGFVLGKVLKFQKTNQTVEQK